MVDYKYQTLNHNLKIGNEVYVFHQIKKFPLIIQSINTWLKCTPKDDINDIHKITEGMDVYIEFIEESDNGTYSENCIYQDLIDSAINENEKIQRIIKTNKVYFNKMKDKINENWYPPFLANKSIKLDNSNNKITEMPSDKIQTFIILNKNGDVLNVKIIKSNGYKTLDDSCIQAIKKAKNFGELPNAFQGKITAIPFTFNYKSE